MIIGNGTLFRISTNDDPALGKYSGRLTTLQRFIIGLDYEGIKLPEHTREVHDFRFFSTVPRSNRPSVNQNANRNNSSITGYIGQGINYVMYEPPKRTDYEIIGIDDNGDLQVKSASGGSITIPLAFDSIQFEENLPGNEVDLEVMLGIHNTGLPVSRPSPEEINERGLN
tara:strand:+ start:50 stop:559 length:510 start_codon:yes stop_codon:yes gene_type:complete